MRGALVSLILMIVCAAAQSTWPTWLRVQGQAPDLTLAAVICVGLSAGAAAGLTAGFLGAFFWGAVSSSPLGHLFLSHMSLGFVAGSLRGRVFSDRVAIAVLLVGVSVILASVIALVLAPPASPRSWFPQMLGRAAYSALMTIPIYLLVRSLARFYPEPEKL